MTATVTPGIGLVGAGELSPVLVGELRAAGLLRGAVTRAAGLRGPLLTRWSVGDAGGNYLWVDEPGLRAVPAVAALPPGGGLGRGEIALPAPVPLAHGLAWRVPWLPQLLADATEPSRPGGGAPGGPRGGAAPDEPMLAAAEAVGRFLRRLHSGPTVGRGRAPRLFDRLARGADGSLAARPQWRRLAASLAGAGSDRPARLHGEPASGHLLIPAERHAPGPRAVLLGWTQPTSGPAALDIGYLIGDLLELSVFRSGGGARATLLAMAGAARRGYLAAGPLPAGFWHRAAAAAALKILDHDLRLRSAGFAVGSDTADALELLARDLLDPASALGAYLAPHAVPARPVPDHRGSS